MRSLNGGHTCAKTLEVKIFRARIEIALPIKPPERCFPCALCKALISVENRPGGGAKYYPSWSAHVAVCLARECLSDSSYSVRQEEILNILFPVCFVLIKVGLEL